MSSPIYGGGGGNYRYVGETSDASSITTTEYYKKILQLILTLAFPCTFNKYFMFINNDIAQAYVTILIQGLNDFILLCMFWNIDNAKTEHQLKIKEAKNNEESACAIFVFNGKFSKTVETNTIDLSYTDDIKRGKPIYTMTYRTMQVVGERINLIKTSFALRIVAKNCPLPLGHRIKGFFRVWRLYKKGLLSILKEPVNTELRIENKHWSVSWWA